MSSLIIQESTLTAIGDAIRSKTGSTALISPTAMPTEIANIQTGGSTHDGSTPETAYTVTEAYEYISSLANKAYGNYIYVIGTVNSFTDADITAYGNATFTITDGISTVKPYRAKGLNNINFSNRNELVIGDVVLIYGRAQKYSSTSFQISNGYIVEYKSRPNIVEKTIVDNSTYYPSTEIWMPITVNVPTGGGGTPGQSKDEPITVSRAYSIASTLASGEVSPNKYYVFGKVTGTISHGSKFTTFDITDGTNTLKCYQMKMEDGTAPKNTYPDFEAGSYITIYTEFKNYSGSLQCNLPVLVTFENNILNGIVEGSAKTIDFNNMTGCTSIKNYLFEGNGNLTSVNISNEIRTIKNSAFMNCSSLQSVTFAEGSVLHTINTGAFFGCSALSSITLPESLTYVGNSIFVNCISLASLYIPGSLTTLGTSFAAGCTALTDLTISEGVQVIGEQAFNQCSALETLTLPSTITEIQTNAFSYCTKLTTINYAGTCDEWIAISKWNSWNYNSIQTVQCSDGTISATE